MTAAPMPAPDAPDLAAIEQHAAPWIVTEDSYAEWERTHPARAIADCCQLACDVLLLIERVRQLEAREATLTAALEWYAEAANYCAPIDEHDTTEPVFFDNGERARAALQAARAAPEAPERSE